jgi:hypothetical protein
LIQLDRWRRGPAMTPAFFFLYGLDAFPLRDDYHHGPVWDAAFFHTE